ncbi:MAG: hypothetical protein E5V89_01060 [Mesorhizobium sp.]|uniref:hypothetical protein n=1 Tax=Mesorhizobium sp. TaxID=1871066 RepID=UPI0012287172|nr:hypothetical protein [Mesorhizobium sp.]TIS78843.1 MAG: hypothetical protein E5W94_08000 [Mesorhizobium sp.]TIV73254.1 MAG: hypothetical protein E5V89_01060 [Mesorhizobium sp.]
MTNFSGFDECGDFAAIGFFCSESPPHIVTGHGHPEIQIQDKKQIRVGQLLELIDTGHLVENPQLPPNDKTT